MSGFFGGVDGGSRRGLGLRLFDIDAALEQRSVLNADASRNYVSDEFCVFADIDLVRSFDISLDLTKDDDLAGANAGLHTTVRPNGNFVLNRLDRPLDIAIDVEVFLGEDLAVDFNRLSNHRGIPRFCFRYTVGC